MTRLQLAAPILAGFTLAACAAPPPPAPAEPPRVVTQPYFEPEIVDWALAYRDALGETLPFDIDTRTRSDAIGAVEAGEAAIVITSGDPPAGWFATPLGRVGLAIIVHPDNPVRDLDLEEVRALFAGRTASWADVGGDEALVQPVLPLPEEPAGESFLAMVLGEGRPWPGTLLAPTAEAMIQIVGADQGAIGLILVAALSDAVQPVRVDGVPPDAASVSIGRYPLVVEIIATAPGEPAPPVRDFLVWLQSRATEPSG